LNYVDGLYYYITRIKLYEYTAFGGESWSVVHHEQLKQKPS